MSNADLIDKPCSVAGCPNRRAVSTNGKVQPRCLEHLRAYWRIDAAKRDAEQRAAKGLPAPQHGTSQKPPAGTRECKVCGVRKPSTVENFPPARRGLSYTCRACKPVNVLPPDSDQIDCLLVDHNVSRLLIVRMKIVDESTLPLDADERRLAINLMRRENLVLEYGNGANTPPVIQLQPDLAPIFWRYAWSD